MVIPTSRESFIVFVALCTHNTTHENCVFVLKLVLVCGSAHKRSADCFSRHHFGYIDEINYHNDSFKTDHEKSSKTVLTKSSNKPHVTLNEQSSKNFNTPHSETSPPHHRRHHATKRGQTVQTSRQIQQLDTKMCE